MVDHWLGDPPMGSRPGAYCTWPYRAPASIRERPTRAGWLVRILAMIGAREH